MKKKFAKVGLIVSTAALAAAGMTLSASAASNSSQTGSPSIVPSLVIMVLLFAVMYFILIRPQKKKEKEQKAMQRDLRVGDRVVTIGGIVGLVVKTTEDTVVVECGGDRSRIRLKKWAIQENVTIAEDNERAREAALAEAQKKKEAKKKGKNNSEENTDAKNSNDQGMLKD